MANSHEPAPAMSAPAAITQIFEPHGRTQPGAALRALWSHRRFVRALASSELRAANVNTLAGHLWTVLDPFSRRGCTCCSSASFGAPTPTPT